MLTVYVLDLNQLLDGLPMGQWPEGISTCRRRRIERFVKQGDKRRALAAGLLMRRVIAAHAGVPESDIVIKRDEYEKPYLPALKLFFNISHSGERVACAIDTAPVGVDIERIRPVPEMMEIARSHFSARECSSLASCAPAQRLVRFYEYWTLKESYIKAIGKGLSMPLDSFSVRIRKNGLAKLEPPQEPPWFLRVYPVDFEYRLAVCAAAPDLPRDLRRELP